MRILYIGRYNESENLSGPEKVAKRIYNQSSKKSETAFIEYFFDGSEYNLFQKLFGSKIENAELNVHRLGLFRILPFIFEFKPQLLHIITFERFAVISYLYKLFSKVKVIYNVHGIAKYENENLKQVSQSVKIKDSFCEKIFMKFSDKLLFLSEMQLSISGKHYNVNPQKIEFINNGVDEEFHNTERGITNNEFPSMVFIGDSERKDKDFNFLYSNLSKIKHNCVLYVIGNFNAALYKNQIENVTIMPVEKMPRNSLVKFLSDKDIFISSSSYDTFSIATAECMVSGLVPVVTNTTGISKLIINNENGFVVKYGDGNDLTDKINLLLNDLHLRAKMAQKASGIYADLNWNTVYNSYEKIYNKLF